MRYLRAYCHHGYLWVASAALATLLTYIELLRAYRRDDWMLGSAVQWFGVAVGFLLYALVLGFVAHLLCLFTRWWIRGRKLPPVAVPLCVVVAGLGLLGLIALCSDVRSTFLAAVGCAVIGFGCTLFFARYFLGVSAPAFCVIACAACLAGSVALVANTHAFLLNNNRAFLVYSISLSAASLAGIVGIAAWYSAPRSVRRVILTLATVTGCGAIPVLVFWLQLLCSGPARDVSQPNVILIVCDAMRADYCSVHGGHVSMPTFEALAHEGAFFEKGYSLAPWTVPSMFAMFASNYQPRLTPGLSRQGGIEESLRYRFDKDTTTLAELLAGRGYVTGALVGNLLLNETDGILRGFQHTRLKSDHWRNVESKTGLLGRMPFLHDVMSRIAPSVATVERMNLSRLLTLYAREFVWRNRGAPFFLWVHYMDPHAPYTPPDEFRTADEPTGRHGTPIRKDPMQNYYISLYSDEIRYVDACIGRVLEELDAQGLRDTTYVCVTADHGEEFWEHGDAGHGQSLYQELVWVPFIVSGPRVVPQRVSIPVSGIDIMPTLAGCVGAQPPAYWRGLDLSPMLRGERQAPPPYPCYANGTAAWRSKLGPLAMVVDGEYKLIRKAGALDAWLFDLAQDPREQTNLSSSDQALAKRLHTQLDEWSETFVPTFAALPASQITPAERKERLEQLRALGYLE